MDWNELKEEAKKMGYSEVIKHPRNKDVIALIHKDLLYGFYPDGTFETDCFIEDDLCGVPIAYDRTPDQMLAIMKALQ